MTEHLVALFDNETNATAAERALIAASIPQSSIRRYNQPGSTTPPTTEPHNGGFWAWLLGEEDGIEAQRARFPNDHRLYDDGVAKGNAVVGVTLMDEAQAERAAAILEDHHPLRIDESTHPQNDGMRHPAAVPSASSAPQPTAAARQATAGDEVIPVREEQINIGKRRVEGVTRVRRYIVEKPVKQDVTLRGEKVTIERRRPVAGATGGALEERTVEIRESQEMPVVEKTARVVEEVVIKKEATERTERVRDTVRREEVEISETDATAPRTVR